VSNEVPRPAGIWMGKGVVPFNPIGKTQAAYAEYGTNYASQSL